VTGGVAIWIAYKELESPLGPDLPNHWYVGGDSMLAQTLIGQVIRTIRPRPMGLENGAGAASKIIEIY
jgi:hypothetical protein